MEERALTLKVSRHKQAERSKKENRSKSDSKALNQLQDMVKDFAQGFSQSTETSSICTKHRGLLQSLSTLLTL